MRRWILIAGIVAVSAILVSFVRSEDRTAPLTTKLGGDTTRLNESDNAFGLPAANISSEERRKFELGDSFFTQNWVTAPASTVARDGLGPTFNAQACATCHVKDGRGATPESSTDTTTRGLLFRLSIPGNTENGGPLPEPNYGGQLQDRAIADVPVEGRMVVEYEDTHGTYGDGSPFSLRKPKYGVTDLAFGPLHPETMISPRLAPQMVGVGLLEAVPDKTISAFADPDDKNGDGISGRPNYIGKENQKVMGRFGWKANQPSVHAQVAGAFSGDLGITSSAAPQTNCPSVQTTCAAAPNGGEPEIDDARLDTVVFYSRTLAVPSMRDIKSSEVIDGATQFMSMGCATCHRPTMKTGESDIPALSNQTIHPFTDLLLHDMGPDLADNRPDFEASGSEWRTPPLWGLGLADSVNGYRFLLHDGRARTFEEAILWHGGEGHKARENFRNATAPERAALIRYLESL